MDDPFGSGWDEDAEAGTHQRIAHRDSMFLHAQIVRSGATDMRLRVRNLSAGGMMAETTDPFVVGEPMTVHLRGIGTVQAQVAWVRDGRIGIAFDRQVDPRLTRKVAPQSPGSALTLVPPVTDTRRPALRKG